MQHGHVPLQVMGLVLALVAACSDCGTTHFAEVPVQGLPTCEPTEGGPLKRPVMVDLRSGDTHIAEYFMGSSTDTSVSVPRGRRTWEARFGLCSETDPDAPTYSCDRVDWYEQREVTLDPGVSGAKLPLPAPPQDDCWLRD